MEGGALWASEHVASSRTCGLAVTWASRLCRVALAWLARPGAGRDRDLCPSLDHLRGLLSCAHSRPHASQYKEQLATFNLSRLVDKLSCSTDNAIPPGYFIRLPRDAQTTTLKQRSTLVPLVALG